MESADLLQIEVSLDGEPIPGLLRASIATTNHFSADTYALTLALDSSVPDGLAFWSAISSAFIEVTAVISTPYGSTYQSLITGRADALYVDPIQRTVGIEGRDLSASMIDSYRQQDFVNQTASEIVMTLASYHNLIPVVTRTLGNVGRYYSDGYTKLSLGQFSRLQSDWDLLVQLARQSDFDVFVAGQSLYFQPSRGFDLVPLTVFLQNMQSARIMRNLNVSTDTVAKVQSWNSQNMAAYDSSGSDGIANGYATSVSGSPPFLFSGSNYTSQQVTDAAGRYMAELTRLGTTLSLNMPWDLAFAPRATCLLLGTGSEFDTTYRIDSVERQYCSSRGSRQVARALQI